VFFCINRRPSARSSAGKFRGDEFAVTSSLRDQGRLNHLGRVAVKTHHIRNSGRYWRILQCEKIQGAADGRFQRASTVLVGLTATAF
jgi:hypothetical protein